MAQEFDAGIIGSVVHDDNFVACIAFHRFDDGREEFFKKILTVPIGNNDTSRRSGRPLIGGAFLFAKCTCEICRGQSDDRQEKKQRRDQQQRKRLDQPPEDDCEASH